MDYNEYLLPLKTPKNLTIGELEKKVKRWERIEKISLCVALCGFIGSGYLMFKPFEQGRKLERNEIRTKYVEAQQDIRYLEERKDILKKMGIEDIDIGLSNLRGYSKTIEESTEYKTYKINIEKASRDLNKYGFPIVGLCLLSTISLAISFGRKEKYEQKLNKKRHSKK